MSVLSHCDLLMISDRYYSSRSIASITLTSRAFESETWSRLPPWDPRQRGTSREDPTSGPPRADGFRRRVKRGKEGLGCVSLPPSGAHLPSPQQSRTVRSGQEPRRWSQTAQTSLSPLPSGFFHLRQTFQQAFHLSSSSCLRYFRPFVSLLSFLFSLTILHALHEIRESTFRLIRRSTWGIFSIFEGDSLLLEDCVSRDGEIEDAPVVGIGGDGLATAAMVMVVVVVLVPVKKRKKKKRKKKTYIGGGSSSLLHRTPLVGMRQYSKIVVT